MMTYGLLLAMLTACGSLVASPTPAPTSPTVAQSPLAISTATVPGLASANTPQPPIPTNPPFKAISGTSVPTIKAGLAEAKAVEPVLRPAPALPTRIIDGDLVVAGKETIANERIILNGGLKVKGGGRLTVNNSVLEVNKS